MAPGSSSHGYGPKDGRGNELERLAEGIFSTTFQFELEASFSHDNFECRGRAWILTIIHWRPFTICVVLSGHHEVFCPDKRHMPRRITTMLSKQECRTYEDKVSEILYFSQEPLRKYNSDLCLNSHSPDLTSTKEVTRDMQTSAWRLQHV